MSTLPPPPEERVNEEFSNALNFKCTDTANAERFNQKYGDEVRYDHRRGRWLIWKEHHWKPDIDGEIRRFAIETARDLYQDAIAVDNLKEREAISKWATKSEGMYGLTATTEIAKSLLPIADAGENWDSNLMLLGCKNGVVDLEYGTLRDGLPEDRITMSTGVDYEPDAECPRWERFINEIFEDNTELIRYVHKALGYSITGSEQEQVAFFCFGTGSNGKSVLFKTITSVLGDYAYDAPASLFQRSTMNTSSNDVAATEFKRFLVSSETLSTSKLNEQRLKGWTGGDKVTARYLYKEYFSFEPTVKPWLFINHKPQVEDDSYGFWRRVRLIPFNRQFKGSEADTSLQSTLKNELPGILNWLIEGCLLWQNEGLEPTPEIVLAATQEYRGENDVLSDFIVDCCVEEPEKEVRAIDLYKAYTKWSEENGLKSQDTLSSTQFGRRCSDKFIKQRTGKGIFYKGIALSNVGFDEKSVPNVGLTPQNSKTPMKSLREGVLLKTTPNPTFVPKNPTQPYIEDSEDLFENGREEI